MLEKRITSDYGLGCTGIIWIGNEILKYLEKLQQLVKLIASLNKALCPTWGQRISTLNHGFKKENTVFQLADDMADNIKWQFYEESLQAIEENRYLIESIIRKRKTQQGTHEFLLNWKRWPTKFNSCVKEEHCDYIEK